MDIDKQQVLELLYDAIEREDWSLVEEAIKVIKGCLLYTSDAADE